MPAYLTLLASSANRVYQHSAPALAAAELAVTAPWASGIRASDLCGAGAVRFDADDLDELALAAQSSGLVTFELVGDLLRPVGLPSIEAMDDDLLTIPKYQGKTNESFTRLLLHVTLSQVSRPGPLDVLDPLAGRGTTLLAAWVAGHNGYGVEADDKAVDALAAFIKTYLRTKRLKHSAGVTPVRREGRTVGRRLDAEVRLAEPTHDRPAHPGLPTLRLTVFTGDTRTSAELYGKRQFDAIVTDAPYGVVHGARRGSESSRSAAALLAEAVPVWARQLRPGGAMGISWNTLSLGRADLVGMLADAGLEVRDEEPWRAFGHRVDQAIVRDLVVAVRPLQVPSGV
ncbi:SAM-dependent methyltransferase [Brooklawnia cerclae]|uniref:SAM-dependent methyltransferase n=1 Tax=Brooklawnia cerclae TaxID=349934 RepID=A0ABX0SFU0_9ACTN|nr:SAM-dependent methyltransferase [Brooklawnia cerclae]